MAKSKLPNALERRHLIERDHTPAQARRYAEAYLSAGRDCDAIEFLAQAEATEELDALRAKAIETGDAFLLRSVLRATGGTATSQQWRSLAEAAARAGKDRYAADARPMVDRGEG